MKTIALLAALTIYSQVQAAPFIRFWQGTRLSTVDEAKFIKDLGEIFLPLTVSVGQGKGLLAYMPALPSPSVGRELPCEVALVVYSSEADYKALRSTPAGQAYSEAHWDYFDKSKSKSAVVEPYTRWVTTLTPGHAYVAHGPADDWQKYEATFHVTLRDKGWSDDFFREELGRHLQDVKFYKGLRSYVVLMTDTYALGFAQWEKEPSVQGVDLKKVGPGKVIWKKGEGFNFQF